MMKKMKAKISTYYINSFFVTKYSSIVSPKKDYKYKLITNNDHSGLC